MAYEESPMKMKTLIDFVKWILDDIDRVFGVMFLIIAFAVSIAYIIHNLKGCS